MNDENMMEVTSKVKWFNQFKGYGFIEVENIPEDIFLHFSIIDQSGIKRLNNDDVILCKILKSDKGYQVISIVELVHSNKFETEGGKPQEVVATMKWFNPSKGFGFAQLNSGEDVFIHSNLLKKHRLGTIESGQKVLLIVHHTNFGYEALDLVIEN